ncbi:MAG TPA: hypothetical protein VF469_16130 [Kofleriaceae bacterium]
MLRTSRGALVEYAVSLPPLILMFELNPEYISRSRTITVKTGNAPGTRGGYDFVLPTETPRVAQGVTVQPETLTIEVLFDATDRMNGGDPIASIQGVQPELDTLRAMIEPKTQGPGGLQMLSSLGAGAQRAFQRQESPSVLLFAWGEHVLPVFLTSIRVEERAHLPSLVPYRANATLTMQVIEGNNPFYLLEQLRILVGATVDTGQQAIDFARKVFF